MCKSWRDHLCRELWRSSLSRRSLKLKFGYATSWYWHFHVFKSNSQGGEILISGEFYADVTAAITQFSSAVTDPKASMIATFASDGGFVQDLFFISPNPTWHFSLSSSLLSSVYYFMMLLRFHQASSTIFWQSHPSRPLFPQWRSLPLSHHFLTFPPQLVFGETPSLPLSIRWSWTTSGRGIFDACSFIEYTPALIAAIINETTVRLRHRHTS